MAKMRLYVSDSDECALCNEAKRLIAMAGLDVEIVDPTESADAMASYLMDDDGTGTVPILIGDDEAVYLGQAAVDYLAAGYCRPVRRVQKRL